MLAISGHCDPKESALVPNRYNAELFQEPVWISQCCGKEKHPNPSLLSRIDLLYSQISQATKKYGARLSIFLGAFAKLRKATISLFMCVRLSVRMEQLGSHRKVFH
jgi:hypothetical protein